MLTSSKRKITLDERPWAKADKYRHLLGTYLKEERSGIYFSERTDESCVARIVKEFCKLPAELQELCRSWELTVSTCWGFTQNGNSSTFYADFKQPYRERVSPHIEIGARSLVDGMLLPHLAHETAHLWWRSLPEQARAQYASFLAESCRRGTVEVTEYVDAFFRDWLRSLDIPASESWASNHQQSYLAQWAEESFCDTVALLVAPGYPSCRKDSTINLKLRRAKIRELTGLALP